MIGRVHTHLHSFIFWVCMAVALIVSGFLFKDLADISQWIIQSPRETTMWVWYHRFSLAAVALLAIAVAGYLKLRYRDIIGTKTMTALSLIFAFQFYSGFINPHIMMRARQHDGVFVSVHEAVRYVKPDESVIVLEVNGHARAHPDQQVLRPHVAGKNTIGGENIVMTYCGLTNLGMAVTPEINGQAVELRPMTQLENNLVMYDANTMEPIQQLWAQKESDVNAGNLDRMLEWPTFRMPFAKFAMAYPEGEVFINDYVVDDLKPTFWQNPFLAIYDPLMDAIFE